MKEKLNSLKKKFVSLWKWLRKNCLNREMIIYILVAEVIFWSPVIVTALLALIINPWFWTICSAIMIFWAGPFTPAVPLQLGLAIGLKTIVNKIRKRNQYKWLL